ncbi:hypothetical protein [Aureimonas sp. N4]|uniref:hypothetical protein n=1 Tax=Aureimonas sp. N4 TaxID=1638165 RepID=UPI0012E3BC4D|nr:hypothetical protein [Aureimonas sp. N4]
MSLINGLWAAFIFLMGLIVTNIVANAWRRRGWLFEQKMTYTKERYLRRSSIISSSFSLIDVRITASRTYIGALRELKMESICDERKIYRLVVNEWHSKIHSLITEMKESFSYQLAYNFDHYFPPEFSKVDSLLGNARRDIEASKGNHEIYLKEAVQILDILNAEARNMSADMQRTMERDKTYIEQRPEVTIENIEILSHTYLLKALFQPRSNA